MSDEKSYLYAYYLGGGNSRMICLIPESNLSDLEIDLRDLNGFLKTKIPLRLNHDRRIVDNRFSITFKKEIAEEYKGEYTEIRSSRDIPMEDKLAYLDSE